MASLDGRASFEHERGVAECEGFKRIVRDEHKGAILDERADGGEELVFEHEVELEKGSSSKGTPGRDAACQRHA
jgi:hypothetical protein